jgi:GT2 family glycosyltransferase
MRKTITNTVIIIITYNGSKWINRCLQSCEAHDVVVVDNFSTDRTLEIIENKFPLVTVVKQKKNLGFGAANNLGIAYALNNGADSVFLLNQDAYLFTDTINILREKCFQNNEYGILSPIHLNVDEKRLDAAFSEYLNYTNNNFFVGDLYNQCRKKIYDVSFVNAAGWFISQKALVKVGGFDPIFFHYGEDNNLCQRVLFHNFKIGVATDARMIHDREGHIDTKIDKSFFSSFYLRKQENTLKSIYGNPLNNEKKISVKGIKRMQITKLLQLEMRDFFRTFKLNRLRKLWFKQSIQSRLITRKIGSHYLKLD